VWGEIAEKPRKEQKGVKQNIKKNRCVQYLTGGKGLSKTEAATKERLPCTMRTQNQKTRGRGYGNNYKAIRTTGAHKDEDWERSYQQ